MRYIWSLLKQSGTVPLKKFPFTVTFIKTCATINKKRKPENDQKVFHQLFAPDFDKQPTIMFSGGNHHAILRH